MNLILKTVPEFESVWQAHIEYWGDDVAGLSNDLNEFSAFMIGNITEVSGLTKQNIFLLVEELLNTGDVEVKDAIATCFLENLLNAVSDNKLSSNEFVHFLGKESRNYCKSWDGYTGVETPNL